MPIFEFLLKNVLEIDCYWDIANIIIVRYPHLPNAQLENVC